MNTTDISAERDCGNSVIELLRVITVITIAIPLLILCFDANETQLNRNVDGILVREMSLGVTPKVNLNNHRFRFDGFEHDDFGADQPGWVKTKSAFLKQRIAEQIPGLVKDKQLVVPQPSQTFELSAEDLKQIASESSVNPMALMLPAARSEFLTEEINDPVPVALPTEPVAESVPPFEQEEQLQSAKDFVDSLIQSAYEEKGIESDIFTEFAPTDP